MKNLTKELFDVREKASKKGLECDIQPGFGAFGVQMDVQILCVRGVKDIRKTDNIIRAQMSRTSAADLNIEVRSYVYKLGAKADCIKLMISCPFMSRGHKDKVILRRSTFDYYEGEEIDREDAVNIASHEIFKRLSVAIDSL